MPGSILHFAVGTVWILRGLEIPPFLNTLFIVLPLVVEIVSLSSALAALLAVIVGKK
jgi:hypothetical protein